MNKVTNRKIELVADGADFLGLHHCEWLLNDGHDVNCVTLGIPMIHKAPISRLGNIAKKVEVIHYV
jgi:hypothetical protein